MCNDNKEITVETSLDLDKVYDLPEHIQIIQYKDLHLAVYSQGILWIVLYNQKQCEIFCHLRRGKTIGFLLDHYSQDDVVSVLIQIEAKKFETAIVRYDSEKNAYIYLTNNCNQRCRHCYMFAGERHIDEVPAEKWFSVLEALVAAGYTGVTFTGGEITVYKDFDKVIQHAHNCGLSVTVLTNGILWNKKLINRLHTYIDEVQVSIDGYDAESYMKVRQYDGFDKAVNCAKLFCENGNKVSIAVTPLFEDIEQFTEQFEPFALQLLKEYPNLFIKVNHELIPGRKVKVTDAQNHYYRTRLKLMIERIYPNYYTETFVLNYQDKANRTNCGFGGISIAPNGDVYWCNRIHELTSNVNVFQTDMASILEMSEQITKSTSVDNTNGCKDCAIRYICGGGCRMKYSGIQQAGEHLGPWEYHCDKKESILEKMVLSNEFFFE